MSATSASFGPTCSARAPSIARIRGEPVLDFQTETAFRPKVAGKSTRDRRLAVDLLEVPVLAVCGLRRLFSPSFSFSISLSSSDLFAGMVSEESHLPTSQSFCLLELELERKGNVNSPAK